MIHLTSYAKQNTQSNVHVMCWPYRIALLFKPFSSSGTWTNEERVTSQDGVGDSTVTGPAGQGR